MIKYKLIRIEENEPEITTEFTENEIAYDLINLIQLSTSAQFELPKNEIKMKLKKTSEMRNKRN